MGDPKKLRKKYDMPKKPWDKNRIVSENEIITKYGLKNKKEIWRIKTLVSRKRKIARELLVARAEVLAEGKSKLINSLFRLNILPKDANLDDILNLGVPDFLERRVQTLVFRKGLANSMKQARQFIVHGFISINGKKVKSPSYLVTRDEENKIDYYKGKPKVLDVKFVAPEEQQKALDEKTEEIKEEIKEAKAEAVRGE